MFRFSAIGCPILVIALAPTVTQAADIIQPTYTTEELRVTLQAYYLTTGYGGHPAFGELDEIDGSGIDDDSHALDLKDTGLHGYGVRAALRKNLSGGWFAGAAYTGFFTDGGSSLGNDGSDTDDVHANLLDRSLADDAGLNGDFDDGIVDYASEDITLHQHFGDLVLGRERLHAGGHRTFWQGGVRLARTDLERDVEYRNNEGGSDLDTAEIDFKSEMRGIGPTLGAGMEMMVMPGLTLSASASASVLYADYDLSRRDAYFNETANDLEIRDISADHRDFVPVIDASVGVTRQWGAMELSLGYTVSAWLGGAKSITTNGWDDIDGDTTPYTIDSDNLITHGLFAKASWKWGG